MRLSVRTPLGEVVAAEGVRRLIVHTPAGSYGIRPRRLDLVLPLDPGLLAYEDDRPRWIAVDAGALVKAGPEVVVLTRRAFPGELPALRALVARELAARRDADRRLGEALAALEAQFVRGLAEVDRAR